jgi:YfiH family protein
LRGSSFDDLALIGHPCWLNQVHGTDVVIAKDFDTPPDADATIGCSIGDICVIRTADCLPVLISSVDGTEVAAAHAGWRGLAAGIIEATVSGMQHDPDELLVWLGPAISQPAFEVGDEVRAAFVAQMPDDAEHFEANARGRWQADLYGLARRRLKALGVAEVTGGGFCTFTDRERFYSYRRNPDCGRMVSFIAMQGLEK